MRAHSCNDSKQPQTAIPRQLKRTAIALLIVFVRALRMLGRIVASLIATLVLAPLLLVARYLLRPILLRLYRLTFPLRLAFSRAVTPGWHGLLRLLTTRRVAHALIVVLTIVVTTGSLAAQEVGTRGHADRSLLSHLVTDEVEGALTAIAPRQTLPTRGDGGDSLTLSDAAAAAETELADSGDALAAPLLSETTPAGTPRREVVRYTVKGGDTISGIATGFGITNHSVLWANGLLDTDYIKPGQQLTIPPISGVLHTVKSGETLSGIAGKYHANPDAILEFNQLASADALATDQLLVVPGGEVDAPRPTYVPRQFAQVVPGRGPATPPPSVPSHGQVVWPTSGHRINRGYLAYHRALDIEGNIGSPVYAADDGVVESVSYLRYGYGFHVVVNHGDGIKTLYAHNGRMFVQPGQRVKAGQTISTVGLTGRTSGAHLHFEVFVNGVKVNPWGYLR